MKKIIIICVVLSTLFLGVLVFFAIAHSIAAQERVAMIQEQKQIEADIQFHNALSDFNAHEDEMMHDIIYHGRSERFDIYVQNWPLQYGPPWTNFSRFQSETNSSTACDHVMEMGDACRNIVSQWNETNGPECARARYLDEKLGDSR
jgi:hypothetical protein